MFSPPRKLPFAPNQTSHQGWVRDRSGKINDDTKDIIMYDTAAIAIICTSMTTIMSMRKQGI